MRNILRWIPAVLIMLVIFLFSSTPSDDLPTFGFWDTVVKKGGHFVGYALLGFAYFYALNFQPKYARLAWILAIAYALTDEFHQTFTAGRHPSLWDVILFDSTGAGLAILLSLRIIKQKSEARHGHQDKPS